MEDVQDLTEMEMPQNLEEHGEEKGAEAPGERALNTWLLLFGPQLSPHTHLAFCSSGETTAPGQGERPSTPTHFATRVF